MGSSYSALRDLRYEFEDFRQPWFNPVEPQSELIGQLVSRGPGGVFWLMREDEVIPEAPKRLTDILKFVRLESEGSENIVKTKRVLASNIEDLTDDEAESIILAMRQEVIERYRNSSRSKSVKTIRDVVKNGESLTAKEMLKKNVVSITYKQHYLVKTPNLNDYLSVVEQEPEHKLIRVWPIGVNLTLFFLLGRPQMRQDKPTISNFVPILTNSMPSKKKFSQRGRCYHSHTTAIHLVCLSSLFLFR